MKNISFWKFLFRFLPQNEYLSSAFSLNFLISSSVGQNLCLDFVAMQKHSIQPSQGLSPNTELLYCQTTRPVRNKRFPKSLRWSIYFFFFIKIKLQEYVLCGVTWLLSALLLCFLPSKLTHPRVMQTKHATARGDWGSARVLHAALLPQIYYTFSSTLGRGRRKLNTSKNFWGQVLLDCKFKLTHSGLTEMAWLWVVEGLGQFLVEFLHDYPIACIFF